MPVAPRNGGPQFYYHGTSEHNADGILAEGSIGSRDGLFGPGFYSTTDEAMAHRYANRSVGQQGVVLRGTTPAKIKNFASSAEVKDYLRSKGKDPYDSHLLSGLVGREGYGEFYLETQQTLVTRGKGTFHPNALRGRSEPWTDLT